MREPKVAKWKEHVTGAGCTIHSMRPIKLIRKKNRQLLFGLFEVDVSVPEGGKLLPIAMIRGDACIIVPCVRNRKTGRTRYVMIRQRRTGCGDFCLEFPAGMLDTHVNDPLSIAVEELHEETGLRVSPEKLFPLFDRPLYTSPGLQDEAIYYFGCCIDLSDGEFRDIEGRKTGKASEGEEIIVTLATAGEGKRRAISAQVLLGFHLFEERGRLRKKME